MSVANGVRFRTTDLSEITVISREWKRQVHKLTKIEMAKRLAEHVVCLIDDPASRGGPIPGRVLRKAYDEVKEERDKIVKTGYRNPRYDFEFAMPLFLFEGALYARIICEQQEWVKKFKKLKLRAGDPAWVEDYSYWDSSERPRSITAADWKERGRIWNTIYGEFFSDFGHDGLELVATVPESHMFTLTMAEDVLKAITPYEARLKRVAANIVVSRKIKNEYPDINSGEAHWQVYMDCHRWMRETEVGQTMLGLEIGHQRTILHPREITKAML